MAEPENKLKPTELVENLIQEHGLDHAISIAMANVDMANKADDFYLLSIWREVRSLLRKRH